MMRYENVIVPSRDSAAEWWDIETEDGVICCMQPAQSRCAAPSKLLLPALCHPHIHLDKAYILTGNHPPSNAHPGYSDLAPRLGSFSEALANTSRAKERYTEDDLYLRGSQLLATSYTHGVTSLRAFVELDHVTDVLTLTTAIRLKGDFAHLLEVQICAFAQDPIFSTTHGESNRAIITSALRDYGPFIDALGTTPYVEESPEASLRNIEWAVTTAIKHDLHLDFHLDYTLTPSSSLEPLAFSVVELLQRHDWVGTAHESRTIVLGHCTQLSVLDNSQLARLAEAVITNKLPIHFVGLPTSDLYMMGRPEKETSALHQRPRGTLQVPSMIKDLGLSACIGVNNVGNAFTPFGTGDPLQLASWGVGIYHAGAIDDAKLLYGCVSWRARAAIGLSLGVDVDGGEIGEGRCLQGMLLIENKKDIELPSTTDDPGLKVPARQRIGFEDLVWDPPNVELRSIVRRA
ncbi:amidohydrolase [Biscogniauxia marginata]|nr:amidohydrolase [Biscogniauxia marginata]